MLIAKPEELARKAFHAHLQPPVFPLNTGLTGDITLSDFTQVFLEPLKICDFFFSFPPRVFGFPKRGFHV